MPFSSSDVRPPIVLSRQEMCIIGQHISRDFSPRLFASRVAPRANSRFTPRELLEISRQISREYSPNKASHRARLVLLPVSPRRLHVYWHIAKGLSADSPNRPDQSGAMTLRIYADAKASSKPLERADAEPAWFDLGVSGADGQRDVWLPEALATSADARYRAVLGEKAGQGEFKPWVYSNTASTPHAVRPDRRAELPDAMLPFIMPALNNAASAGKTASGQGKNFHDE
ncbi:DUF4912 domain-containing protein [Methylomonas sp. SURF-2]|uniref:DUF4912 domain-containing protein n=1 Tax=Methylomonas subterranea TaxID=2952225 RepID=A0ABT1TEJ6_9GAMM|nr:DUF4912 domain-containing protein [Methylomonas sp. SURF-2]MCQ8103889.1 DUF4912 domain-containing protein [Methylomonas sp. SURF-2]